MVESARHGGWLASATALAIGGAMLLAALYPLSGAGLIRRLPLTRSALVVLATLCLLRGLLIIPISLRLPQLIDGFEIIVAVVWALAGLGFLLGAWQAWPRLRKAVSV